MIVEIKQGGEKMTKKSLIAMSLVVMMALGVACTNGTDLDTGPDADAPIESPAD